MYGHWKADSSKKFAHPIPPSSFDQYAVASRLFKIFYISSTFLHLIYISCILHLIIFICFFIYFCHEYWSEVICHRKFLKSISVINLSNKWSQLIIFILFVRAKSGEYFSITEQYQKLLYQKKFAVKIGILIKSF